MRAFFVGGTQGLEVKNPRVDDKCTKLLNHSSQSGVGVSDFSFWREAKFRYLSSELCNVSSACNSVELL